MLSCYPDADAKAEAAAEFFADPDTHMSHGMGIDRDSARRFQIAVDDLESSQELQDAVLSVYHATMHTLTNTPTVKIIENHLGRAFVVAGQQFTMQLPLQVPMPPPAQLPTRPTPPATSP